MAPFLVFVPAQFNVLTRLKRQGLLVKDRREVIFDSVLSRCNPKP